MLCPLPSVAAPPPAPPPTHHSVGQPSQVLLDLLLDFGLHLHAQELLLLLLVLLLHIVQFVDQSVHHHQLLLVLPMDNEWTCDFYVE